MANITEHSDVSIACSWCDDLRSKVDHFPFFFLPNRLVDHSGNSDLRVHQPRRYDRLCYLQRRYDRPVTLRTRRFALWQHPCHQNALYISPNVDLKVFISPINLYKSLKLTYIKKNVSYNRFSYLKEANYSKTLKSKRFLNIFKIHIFGIQKARISIFILLNSNFY